MNSYHLPMNNKRAVIEPDWALLRAFLAVAEAGSLSRAAVELGSSQPTLSRQMSELEAQTGHALFERSQRGLAPSGPAHARARARLVSGGGGAGDLARRHGAHHCE